MALCKLPCFINYKYSALKIFTGVGKAAFTALYPTATHAIKMDNAITSTKIPQPILKKLFIITGSIAALPAKTGTEIYLFSYQGDRTRIINTRVQ